MRYFVFYKVKDIMTPDPITVAPVDTLAKVTSIFEKHGFSGLPVVDGNDRLLGVITKVDFLKACASKEATWYPAIMRQRSSQVMTKEPDAVHPETPLTRLLKKLIETRTESFPVVDNDRLVGIISRQDVLIALRKASLGVIPARLISPDLKGLLEPTYLHDGTEVRDSLRAASEPMQ